MDAGLIHNQQHFSDDRRNSQPDDACPQIACSWLSTSWTDDGFPAAEDMR